ncbi:hypothetical protein DYBT9275_00707 [Dyadobacter sp. CECT 9275]|uniref:4'-phosphopantetheinyl transferase domain-containing protein n=1 Tax=Dyadobacter helix TaxID=2822344 RepID=A0A916JC64_9BACT|nr:4'-phosphopantetheinyl transferase superfamily protein [Dyadobacter sp. CECT 9275]CAG4991226.1 hypothetical protein DYBT9275_00707 [Dyadobacter sp. CECT 9275]
MPLVHSEKLEGNTTLFLWKLDEGEEELRARLGSKYNLEDLESITHPQKIREWLASRLLIQLLVEGNETIYEGTQKDEHGKAFLVNNNHHISLTHTHDYVAAVINPDLPVGIDMEKVDYKLQRTANKYLSPEEYAHADGELKTLCIYWCAKEALYKQYGKKKISFRDAIHVAPFDSGDTQVNGFLRDEEIFITARVFLRWFDDHCLAVSC